MYLTTISFGLYLAFVFGVIFRVGRILHRVGEVYLKFFFPGERSVIQINNLLLIGYYLVNLGYSLYVLTIGQEELVGMLPAFEWLITKIGFILLFLGLLHANNMVIIYLAHKMRRIRI